MSSGRRDKSTPISYQPPGAQWDLYSMSNVGQRKNPGQSHSSTDPMVDPRQQQQQEHQQRRQEHMHTETQPNPQLLTPQSGTAQRPIRTDFPNASITKPSQEPSKRTLPPTDVTDENLDERYVQFILYCNPSISDAVDTTELRVGLRSPPRSDGKNYSPFVIFRLISRLEAKDIKSWTSLVVEMGVELPDASKNQSTQKVQQYAVRLKVGYVLFSLLTIFPFSFCPQLYLYIPEKSDSDWNHIFSAGYTPITLTPSSTIASESRMSITTKFQHLQFR